MYGSTRRSQAAFTLVEVLVVAPAVIMLLGVMIFYFMQITGEGLRLRQTNEQTYAINNTLATIENDAFRALSFSSNLSPASPQGRNDNTGSFLGANDLIVQSVATVNNPESLSRKLAYQDVKSPSNCGDSTVISNPYVSAYFVYFVKDETLWRRTIMQKPVSSCETIWQEDSCSPGVTGANCQAEDSKLLENVVSFDLTYYGGEDSATELPDTNIEAGKAVRVSITTEKNIAGKPATASGSLRIVSTNLR